MAVCYRCGKRFYGYECDSCGWKAVYRCWNCKSEVDPEQSEKCYSCGWFICSMCGCCGCGKERPQSNEEKRRELGY